MNAIVNDSVRAVLHFAGDLNDGGRHDNADESRNVLNLKAREYPIVNARSLASPPRLDREGFALASHVVSEPDWSNEGWIDNVYTPSCNELVKKLTGAKDTVAFHRPMQRFVDPEARKGHFHPAGFVHIDNPREIGEMIARFFVTQQGKSFKRAAIYNVWKAISPAPQDRPLAIADRRTTPPSTHVRGVTIDQGAESPYIIVTPADGIEFYYFRDMAIDESMVFTGVDLDPNNPVGCAHGAFHHPEGGVPRGSIEARVIAIFE